MVTHSIEDDDDNDNEDKCQHNGYNNDPDGDICTLCGGHPELGDDGHGGLYGAVWGRT